MPVPVDKGQPELAWIAGNVRATPAALAMPRSATANTLTLRD
jgi:hypothetical protein